MQLPYDDVEALTYLNAVSLRVEKGDEVLYNGPYVRIADALPQLSTELAPGEGATLDITAWCQYGYDGDVAPGTYHLGFCGRGFRSLGNAGPGRTGQLDFLGDLRGGAGSGGVRCDRHVAQTPQKTLKKTLRGFGQTVRSPLILSIQFPVGGRRDTGMPV